MSQSGEKSVQANSLQDVRALWWVSPAFLKIAIASIFVAALAAEIVLFTVAPEQYVRGMVGLVVVLVAGVVWILLARGKVKVAIATFGVGIWAYTTLASLLYGGVAGTSIIIYPLTIILAGWLLGARAAMGVALLTTLVTLGFVLGEMSGLLAGAPATHPAIRWIIISSQFILTAALMATVARSYSERLAEVRALTCQLQQRTAELQVIESDLTRAQAVAHIGSWVYDVKADQMQLSAETCRIFGMPPGATGSYCIYLGRVVSADRVSVRDAWKEAVKGGTPFDNEHRIKYGTGFRWVRQKAEISFDTNGVALRAVGTTQDITERKQAEDALRQSEMQMQCILGSTADGILAVDREGQVIQTNQRFADLWRIPPELLKGKDDAALLNYVASQLSDPDAYLKRVQMLYSSDAAVTDALSFKDGRVFERFTAPLILGDVNLGRVWAFRDITERTRAELAHLELEAQLRESQKMEALGTLAGGIAHDFNNVLATVMGNLALAREDIGAEHPAWLSLDEIGKAGIRAQALVRQILAFGRRQVLERKRVRLAPVLEESVRLLRATQPAGAVINLDCEPGAPAVFADALQIEQTVLNLCINAWDAIAEQSRPGVIDIRLSPYILAPNMVHQSRATFVYGNLQPGRYACLSIRDNGCGMDEATQRRIFEPFFTTKAISKGTGLGLSVVHGILQGHDATIEVESARGEGTIFRIYFPATQLPEQEAQDELTLSARLRRNSSLLPDQLGRHVLYIDDDALIVSLMTRLLRRQGYQVTGYTNAAEAIAAFQVNPSHFDIVVTDYNMPGMSGIDVVRTLKSMRADLPIAMASGFLTEELRAEALAAGVVEVIHKTSSVDEFCNAVARLVRA